MSRSGSRIPPLPLALVTALGMWLATRVVPDPSLPLPSPLRSWLATALLLAGLGTVLAAGAALWQARTSVNPLRPEAASSLVVDGIYRLSRNPIYLGLLLLLAAWAVWLAKALPLLALPLYVCLLNRWQILPEERALRERFGPAYEAYLGRVRRWL